MEFMWIIVILFLILAVLFYMGKGGFLIAGYNTSSQEERDKIDEKKLCRVMGNGMLVITLCLVAQILFEDSLPVWLFLGVLLLDLIYIMVVGNTRCKRDPSSPLPEHRKNSKRLTMGASILIGLVTVGIVIFFLLSGSVSIETNASKLTAKATLVTTTKVNYQDIKKVELKEDIDLGNRTNGIGDFKVSAGHFKNDAYGRYMLYSYNKCKTYIVLSLKDQSIVVVNEETKKETKELYIMIKQYVDKN